MKKWPAIFLVIFGLMLLCIHAGATTYYFSDVSGDDSRTSTQAQNQSTPWKSITKLNSFFASLQPGDQVLFKGGETFPGTIIISGSGTQGLPIVIGAYGKGAKPVFTSLINVTGWGAVREGVAESDAFSALQTGTKIVTVNNIPYGIGRYPDITNPLVGNYLSYESHTGKTSITDDQLDNSPNWTGAEVVIRTSRWTIDRGLISSHVGTKLNFIYYNKLAYEPPAGNGYFIQNHAGTLTRFGEWYYNPATGKIKMYFGTVAPSSYTVQAATATNLLVSASHSYITIDNLTFKGANGSALSISGGTNFTVKNCDIMFSGIDGITGSATTNLTVDNCNVLYSYNDGIRIPSNKSATITNNLIHSTYYVAGMGVDGNGQGDGIRNGDNSLVQYNRIIKSGYVGIHLGNSNSRALNNFIDSSCFVKDDGAGIYTFVSHSRSSSPADIRVGQKVIGNIILNGLGAAPGCHGSPNYSPASGIYFDDNANGFEVTDNTIGNHAGFGLFLHNTYNATVTGNTVYNSKMANVLYKDDGLGGLMRDITTTDNIFVSRSATQVVAQYQSDADDISQMGTWDNNYYVTMVPEAASIRVQTASARQNVNLSGWKALYGKDRNSQITLPASVTSSTEVRFEYNDTKVKKTIPLAGTYVNIKNESFENSVTLPPYTSQVLIKTAKKKSR